MFMPSKNTTPTLKVITQALTTSPTEIFVCVLSSRETGRLLAGSLPEFLCDTEDEDDISVWKDISKFSNSGVPGKRRDRCVQAVFEW